MMGRVYCGQPLHTSGRAASMRCQSRPLRAVSRYADTSRGSLDKLHHSFASVRLCSCALVDM